MSEIERNNSSPVPQQPIEVKIGVSSLSPHARAGYALAGVALAAGGLFAAHELHWISFGVGKVVETIAPAEDKKPNKVTEHVAQLDPVALDCRAIMKSQIAGHLHPELVGIPMTGFMADLTGPIENGQRQPEGEADTMLCVSDRTAIASEHVSPVTPDGKQTVTIDLNSLHPFTAINEQKTLVTTSLPALSKLGDAYAQIQAGLTGFLTSIATFGHKSYELKLWSSWDDDMRGEVAQVLRQEEVDRVDTQCVSAALPEIEGVFEQSYYLQADQKHVPRNSVSFEFEGQPHITNTYPGAAAWNKKSHFKIDLKELDKNSPVCSVDPSLSTVKDGDFRVVNPNQGQSSGYQASTGSQAPGEGTAH